ncbi:MAG: Nif11-like leader peptide family natural product precursor [Atopobiaceae bacterium]|nr:Nif11-like leader peptide family natural product precursor [Atopobiaceae bacterium]
MDANNISAELREKAKACQSTDELLELAKNVCYDLSDEELEAVSG